MQVLEDGADVNRFILLRVLLQLPDTRTKDTGCLLRQLTFFGTGGGDELEERWDQKRDIGTRLLFLDVDIHEVKDAVLKVGSLTLRVGI